MKTKNEIKERIKELEKLRERAILGCWKLPDGTDIIDTKIQILKWVLNEI